MDNSSSISVDQLKAFLSQLDSDAKKALFGLLYWEIQEGQDSSQITDGSNLLEKELSDSWPLYDWHKQAILETRNHVRLHPESVLNQNDFEARMDQLRKKFELS